MRLRGPVQALQRRLASSREVRKALAAAEGDNLLMAPVARRQLDREVAKVQSPWLSKPCIQAQAMHAQAYNQALELQLSCVLQRLPTLAACHSPRTVDAGRRHQGASAALVLLACASGGQLVRVLQKIGLWTLQSGAFLHASDRLQ